MDTDCPLPFEELDLPIDLISLLKVCCCIFSPVLVDGEAVLDTTAAHYSWQADWEFLTQSGQSTGNREAQDYHPEQVWPLMSRFVDV